MQDASRPFEVASGLGEVLLEVREPFKLRWKYFIPGAIVLGIGLFGLSFAPASDARLMITIAIVGACVIVAPVYMIRRGLDVIRFSFHRQGISRTDLRGTRGLRFEEIDVFRREPNTGLSDSYSGYLYTFAPPKESELKPVRIGFHRTDDGMGRVRTDVSRMIAQRMARKLFTDKKVSWCSTGGYQGEVTFLAEGIQCKAFSPSPTLFERDDILASHFPFAGTPQTIKYEDIISHRFGTPNGIRIRTKEGIVTDEIPSTEPNFFPGYELLQALIQTREPIVVQEILTPDGFWKSDVGKESSDDNVAPEPKRKSAKVAAIELVCVHCGASILDEKKNTPIGFEGSIYARCENCPSGSTGEEFERIRSYPEAQLRKAFMRHYPLDENAKRLARIAETLNKKN